MFGIRMKDGKNCVVFEAASPESLAGAVTRLIDEPGLYARLSKSAETATEDYLCPLKWDRLIATWLNPNRQTRDSLREFSLSIQYPNLLNGT
jgi:glycosyltransferase involved in cell wall biosynthesis